MDSARFHAGFFLSPLVAAIAHTARLQRLTGLGGSAVVH
jgi:hypothetical protein